MSDKSLSTILEAESHTEETRGFIKQVRRITRRRQDYLDSVSSCQATPGHSIIADCVEQVGASLGINF